MSPFLSSAQKKISFVILTWNSERYIHSCIDSILSIGPLCNEVICVDNGSNDRTLSVLRELSTSDRRVRIIRLDRIYGTTVSRNKALRSITSDSNYVCILDSDTVINIDAISKMVNCLESDQSIGVVGPTMADSLGNTQLSGRNLPTLGIKVGKAIPFGDCSKKASDAEFPSSPIIDGIQDVGYLLSACWLMKVSTLAVVGLLDEHIFYAPEDVDWCFRCHEKGLRVVRCYSAKIIHEYQRLSHKRLISRTNFEHIKGLIYYFAKHRYLFRAPSY